MSFVHTHASGRFDRSADSLEKALDNYVHHEQSSLLTLTEVSESPRAHTLPEQGWAVVQSEQRGRKADCAIMFDTAIWELLKKDFVLVVQGNGKILPVWAVFAILKHKPTGKVVVTSVAHMPRSVEGSTGFSAKEPARAKASVTGSQNWRRQANSFYRDYNADAILLAADWNLNIKKPWVRRYFDKTAPGYDVNWTGRLPKRGTLGRRIIDLALLRGLKVLSRRLLAHNSSSDHTAYRE